ncbi:MAG TPA: 16S rRNA (cytidine(1402)-2'-O)-methyltransferase [Lentisphaeria bacterium]|nr:MAG: 16S rRNA (cytidine(1402)-2'-O)-methyltransferase [Lentisphaerae bacterium GWF2_49_21]HBC85630.1 16S rRNA (cytidine(1402)-2'-O)-methyltransferase [Lentisphaeria bacterium]
MIDSPNTSPGTISIISTPIGNLKDITARALEALAQADIVAAEDTRRTSNLLTVHNLHKKLVSCHIYNEHKSVFSLIESALSGQKVAFVSDAGTPCISDPGFLLVREALKSGIEPQIIPGVSSLTFAVVASGLPVDKFSFLGFLPVKQGRRHKALLEIAEEDKTVFVFESPFRMEKLLKEIAEVIGKDAKVAVIREATKLHEEILRGTAEELVQKTSGRNWKGECVVAIYPGEKQDMTTEHTDDTEKE